MILELNKDDIEHKKMVNRMISQVELWQECNKYDLLRDIKILNIGITKYKNEFKEAGLENTKFMLSIAEETFNNRFMNECSA